MKFRKRKEGRKKKSHVTVSIIQHGISSVIIPTHNRDISHRCFLFRSFNLSLGSRPLARSFFVLFLPRFPVFHSIHLRRCSRYSPYTCTRLFRPDIGGVNERWKRSFHVDTWNPIVENYANLYPPWSLVSRFIRPRIGLSALGTIKDSICHTPCNFAVFLPFFSFFFLIRRRINLYLIFFFFRFVNTSSFQSYYYIFLQCVFSNFYSMLNVKGRNVVSSSFMDIEIIHMTFREFGKYYIRQFTRIIKLVLNRKIYVIKFSTIN